MDGYDGGEEDDDDHDEYDGDSGTRYDCGGGV